MYLLLETIKIKEGSIHNLALHQQRLNASYGAHFRRACPFDLQKIIRIPEKYNTGMTKARFLYGESDWELQFRPYKIREIKSLKLVYDERIDYAHKYVNRSYIEYLREQKGQNDDILIVKNGFLSDTSFSNIIFFDGKHWHTPAYPLLKGICRTRLLQERKITETALRPEDLGRFSHFMLINAMLCGEKLTPVSTGNIIP